MFKSIRLVALVACLSLAIPGAAIAASFGEFASGVKTLTGAAKDVNEINKDNSGNEASSSATQKSSKQSTSTKKSSSSKKSAPKQDSRVRGG